MKIKEYMKNNILCLDGGMGTLLMEKGLGAGELPELWNITKPDVITEIHRKYFDTGSNVVSTNTFGANVLKFSGDKLREIVRSAVENAKLAREQSCSSGEKWIALDIGPTGKMLKPYGDLSFEDAVSIFAQTVKLGVSFGVDLIFIETMNDSYETKAALLAAKENSDLPVFVSNAYGEDGKLMTGASPAAMVAMLCGLGADAIGMNCSLGPRALFGVCEEYLKYSSVPVLLKPNAGLPKSCNGKTVYDISSEEFVDALSEMVMKGVRIVGGCCGTTPEYISLLTSKIKGISPLPISEKNFTLVSSYTHAVSFDKKPVLIGERINPTGKKRFKEALRSRDMSYVYNEAIKQEECGAHILDVNVGLPEINEAEMLAETVMGLQAVVNLPLQIDTSDTVAMEKALRVYNGKAMVNSVNGKEESMEKIFPLVKKYGGVLVALTLDEGGIPESAEGRVEIAKRILCRAEEYGIPKKDIIFDPLALTVSADNRAAAETLRAVKLINEELGSKTSLGVSNVSFGLPERDLINSTFFASALTNGLSAAIMNPYSHAMMGTYHSYLALAGLDENCSRFISYAQSLPDASEERLSAPHTDECNGSGLENAIERGLSVDAAAITKKLLESREPLEIVNTEIIPALDRVGQGFEKKTVYLPQLLMSAEAAKSAFEEIKKSMSGKKKLSDCRIVIATVKGDIHDIGKNIVKLLLENYGYEVYDLGKDVEPEKIAEKAVEVSASIVGLSALMTTTVPAMEETVKLLRSAAPWCKIMVGGAVLTEEYAASIKADKYCKDAMEAVRYAEEIFVKR